AGIPATLLLVVTGGPRLGENHRRMLCSACSLAPDVDVRPSLVDLPGRIARAVSPHPHTQRPQRIRAPQWAATPARRVRPNRGPAAPISTAVAATGRTSAAGGRRTHALQRAATVGQ